jgi:hypothetical protein
LHTLGTTHPGLYKEISSLHLGAVTNSFDGIIIKRFQRGKESSEIKGKIRKYQQNKLLGFKPAYRKKNCGFQNGV